MDFADVPEDAAFRREFRAWLDANLTDDLKVEDAQDQRVSPDRETLERRRAWQKKMHAAGWIGIAWPKDYGGRGAGFMQQVIFDEEYFRARAPILPGTVGMNLLGPTLIHWGTEEQKKRYLPKILSCDEIWCQGYSEPGAGSDLASLRTRAIDRGDHFLVNGQKVWTSGAHFADWCFLLVRTDPDKPKHHGISYLLVDMKTPGIEVRPLVLLNGHRHFNEVFFEDVVVPKENLVGPLNEGWKVTTTTLMFERGGAGGRDHSGADRASSGISEAVPEPAGAGLPREPYPAADRAAGDRRKGARSNKAAQPDTPPARRAAGAGRLDSETVWFRTGDPHRRFLGRRCSARMRRWRRRPSWCRTRRVGRIACSVRGNTRSPAAPAKFSATLSASGFWACREDRTRLWAGFHPAAERSRRAWRRAGCCSQRTACHRPPALIAGLDLSRPLSSDLVGTIRAAILAHHIVVFPDQSLTREQQFAFAGTFGAVEAHGGDRGEKKRRDVAHVMSNLDVSGNPAIRMSRAANYHWHTDKPYQPAPPALTLLYAVEVPPPGQVPAATPNSPIRRWPMTRYPARQSAGSADCASRSARPSIRPCRRSSIRWCAPIPRPAANRSISAITRRTSSACPTAESAALLAELLAHATQPRFVYTHRWRPGDLVMWDNRVPAAPAVADYEVRRHRRDHAPQRRLPALSRSEPATFAILPRPGASA